MTANKYESLIPWNRLKKHIQERLEAQRSLLEAAEGPEAARLQGDVRTLRAMLNLPNTLEALDFEEVKQDASNH